jgi:hypothetical protein
MLEVHVPEHSFFRRQEAGSGDDAACALRPSLSPRCAGQTPRRLGAQEVHARRL